jgi:hypothetical protein|tara:strand:- start:7117 stop:7473 length:357 start_codon:yes stop_codon:yes gene_type:complete
MNINNKQWIPEIYYEEDSDGQTSHIPFISVPIGEKMPNILFMFGSIETGEEEIGPAGEPLPIVDLDLHQYANMNTLRDNLTIEMYDCVRTCLGLESLAEATIKGKKLTDNIRTNIEGS